MRTLAGFVIVLLTFDIASVPLFAHHGVANYDTTKMVSVKGIVTEVEFVNPHVQLSFEVKTDKGLTEKWTGEAQSPAMLLRYSGWDKDTIKVGDAITASGFRTRNGRNYLRLVKIVLPDGRELTQL